MLSSDEIDSVLSKQRPTDCRLNLPASNQILIGVSIRTQLGWHMRIYRQLPIGVCDLEHWDRYSFDTYRTANIRLVSPWLVPPFSPQEPNDETNEGQPYSKAQTNSETKGCLLS